MKKRLGLIAAALVLTAALTACGSNGGDNAGNNAASNNSGVTDTGSATTSEELVVTASNWEFDKQEYTIPQGQDVTLTLKSSEGIHGIEISNTDVELEAGDSTVVNLQAGTYEISCNIPCGTGHRNMKATLVVA